MRLIDADALEKFLKRLRRELPKESRDFFTRDEMTLNFQQYVHMQPTIDAVPVVRGEWKLLDECSNAGVYCSVCHKAVFRERAWYKNVHIQSKFCPNCGARMDGEV